MPPFSAKNLFKEIIRNYLFRKGKQFSESFRKIVSSDHQPSVVLKRLLLVVTSSVSTTVMGVVIIFSRHQSQLPTIVLLRTTLSCMIRLNHQEYSSALHMIQRWKMIPEDLTKKIWNSMESVQYRNQLILLKKRNYHI